MFEPLLDCIQGDKNKESKGDDEDDDGIRHYD